MVQVCVETSPNLRTSENRATGVAYMPNPLFHPDGPTETHTVCRTRLIVISARALGTPSILERAQESEERRSWKVLGRSSVPTYLELARTTKVRRAIFTSDESTLVITLAMHRSYQFVSFVLCPDDAETLDVIYSGDADAIAGVVPSEGHE